MLYENSCDYNSHNFDMTLNIFKTDPIHFENLRSLRLALWTHDIIRKSGQTFGIDQNGWIEDK